MGAKIVSDTSLCCITIHFSDATAMQHDGPTFFERSVKFSPLPRRGKPSRPQVLYWYRTPPGIKVGRAPFDPAIRQALPPGSEILFIDDGSTDGSRAELGRK